MFVGSERMDSIYRSHSADLNKWVNCSLDRIEVDADCKALITQPVAGKIEYEPDAVVRIVEYCQGNPFYMHLVAGKVFRRCVQERRTFVGASDVEQVRRGLVRELGPTNFAHFWEDVPVLDPNDKQRSVAQNCLFLACVSALGSGSYESLDDLVDAQAQMNFEPRDRLPAQELQEAESGLLRRHVISRRKHGVRGVAVELPVFGDWLLEKGEAELLPVWRTFQDEEAAEPADKEPGSLMIVESSAFPIEEDELLSVSEKLVYLGKQKDVAEVRRLAQAVRRRRADRGCVPAPQASRRGRVRERRGMGQRARQDGGVREGPAPRRRRRRVEDCTEASGQPVPGLCGLGDEEWRRDGAGTGEADAPGEMRRRKRRPEMGAELCGERPAGCRRGRLRRHGELAGEGSQAALAVEPGDDDRAGRGRTGGLPACWRLFRKPCSTSRMSSRVLRCL